MNPFIRLFNPLRHAAAAFFKHDVALRRAEGTVQIVLEQRPAAGKAKQLSREEIAKRKSKEELALMRTQLTELLDELPETRQAMRHLVFVEQAIAKKGLRALHRLPLDVLQKALAQFEGLVTNWSPAGLANLRSKIAVAIIDRENMDPDAEADAYSTAAVMDHGPAAAEAMPAEMRSDDEALAAAYAALGNLAPGAGDALDTGTDALDSGMDESVELQGELGTRATRSASREAARGFRASMPPEIKLRELQD